MSHLLRTAVLSDAQHGFVPKHSCLTNLLLTEQWVTQFMDAREPVDIVFLDFARAFDSVNHRDHCIKLDAYRVHPKIIGWVCSFLTHYSFRVRVHDVFSLPFSAGSSVPSDRLWGRFCFYYSSTICQICCKARFYSLLMTSKLSILAPNTTIRK